MDAKGIIKLAMEQLPMSGLNADNYHSFLHEIKNMVLELDTLEKNTLSLEERMNILLLELSKLKALVEDLCDNRHDRIRIPHRCPVCNGSTFDDEGLLCPPCNGSGIVWS